MNLVKYFGTDLSKRHFSLEHELSTKICRLHDGQDSQQILKDNILT